MLRLIALDINVMLFDNSRCSNCTNQDIIHRIKSSDIRIVLCTASISREQSIV